MGLSFTERSGPVLDGLSNTPCVLSRVVSTFATWHQTDWRARSEPRGSQSFRRNLRHNQRENCGAGAVLVLSLGSGRPGNLASFLSAATEEGKLKSGPFAPPRTHSSFPVETSLNRICKKASFQQREQASGELQIFAGSLDQARLFVCALAHTAKVNKGFSGKTSPRGSSGVKNRSTPVCLHEALDNCGVRPNCRLFGFCN